MDPDERPGSPSPTLIEEYAQDPDINFDLDAISFMHTVDSEQPSKLRSPCDKFNKNDCFYQTTCPNPHVCNICFEADHCSVDCPVRNDKCPVPLLTGKGAKWDGNVSCSPCAQASLYAAPLPGPPSETDLPPELVRIVRTRPDLFKIVTPVNVNFFEGLLSSHPNQNFVKSVCRLLREGFWPFAKPPSQLVNESIKQKRYHGAKDAFLKKQVKEEVRSERFSHSFGRRLLLGMACMPIHVTQDQGKSKFRLIYNHSAGMHSLNSLIPEIERSAHVDRIDTLIRTLRNRQLDFSNITLFKSDISHAFRIIPMSPYWQALQAVNVNGQYYIDRCNAFGNAGSQRIFCAFYSLVLWIAENIFRITDVLSYVDDNFSWECSGQTKYYPPYDRFLPKKQARLLGLWDVLGIPHALKKQEFGEALTIIGFQVNLRQMRVTISNERLDRLVKDLMELSSRSSSSMSLHDCQRLAGSINWALEVNPLLRPGIELLHKQMAEANQNYAPVPITERIASDIRWLAVVLRESRGVHFTKIMPWRTDSIFQTVYVRASTHGFGIWFPSVGKAFFNRYAVPEPSSSISDSHLFVVACSVLIVAKAWKRELNGEPKKLMVFTEDKSTVKTFNQLRTRDGLHDILVVVMQLLTKCDLEIQVSQEGMKDDFTLVERLSRASKESLERDYSNIVINNFKIPNHLARYVGWVTSRSERDQSPDVPVVATRHSKALWANGWKLTHMLTRSFR